MEIERKYFIETPPDDFAQHPFCQIEQAYLCTSPVVRIRREDDSFYLTYKSKGLLSREEHNLPLDEASYLHLLEKADGRILKKKRYRIPLADTPYTIELDVFEGDYEGLNFRMNRRRFRLPRPAGFQGMSPSAENTRTAGLP